jgi:transcriptional regulator of met regulon
VSHHCIKLTDKIIIDIMRLMNVERTEEDISNRLRCFPAFISSHMQFLVKKKYLTCKYIHGTRIYALSDTTRRKLEVLRYKSTAASECKAMGGKPGGVPMAKDDDVYQTNEGLRFKMLELMADGSEQTSGSIAALTGRKSKAISDQFLQMHRRGLVNRIEFYVASHKKIKQTITDEGLAYLKEKRGTDA